MQTPEVILTVGHSTRPMGEFLELLRANGVKRVIDVRTIPRSRHNPQFNRDAFCASLRRAHIAYTHLKSLGGLRHAQPDSRNLAWRNASFRGFADYMQTPAFDQGLARLLGLAAHRRCALMCAEAVPWRCHRSLIADALTARRVRVEHVMSATSRRLHRLTPFARMRAGRVFYPGDERPKARLALKYQADMGGKKRKTKFSALKEVKRQAREAAGQPPPARVIADKRRKPQKHRKPLQEENSL